MLPYLLNLILVKCRVTYFSVASYVIINFRKYNLFLKAISIKDSQKNSTLKNFFRRGRDNRFIMT
jgi:hypothetical protein